MQLYTLRVSLAYLGIWVHDTGRTHFTVLYRKHEAGVHAKILRPAYGQRKRQRTRSAYQGQGSLYNNMCHV